MNQSPFERLNLTDEMKLVHNLANENANSTMSPSNLHQGSDGTLDTNKTSRSYVQQKSANGINHTSDHTGNTSDAAASEEHFHVISTDDEADDASAKSKQPLTYTTYLGITTLLSSLRCLSHKNPLDKTSPPVHDEHFFIIVHQGNFINHSVSNQLLFF